MIWNHSRSVNVRKAIARNSNAGPRILRQAARLYLEEVLSNPGFAMLELFDDDEWIRRVSTAYSDPDKYILEYNRLFYTSRAFNNDHFCWAILLSPKLKSWSLDRTVSAMSVGSFRRAVKNKEVRQKINAVYNEERLVATSSWPFSLTTLLTLYKEEVIDSEELYDGLSNYGAGSASASKSVFGKYIKSLHAEFAESEDANRKSSVVKLLAKTYIISRAHVFHWIYLDRESLEQWGGELYTDVLSQMMKRPESNKIIISDNIHSIGSYVSSYIKSKFFKSNSVSAETITEAYKYIMSHGLQDLEFSDLGIKFTLRDDIQELSKCAIEVKDFFCRSGCLGSWVSISLSDPKYSIIEEVNEHALRSSGIEGLLFNKCSIRKVISFNDSTYVF